MRVTVTLSVEVDPAAWDLAYGTGTGARDVAADVKRYTLSALQDSAAAEEGGILSVELR